MNNRILFFLLLMTILLLTTGCIPDIPGPIGIPGV